MKPNVTGTAYAFVHFSVEVASFYFLFSRMNADSYWSLLALMFDAVAFVPQSVFGIVSDRYPRFNMGAVGCLLMCLALIIKADVLSIFALATGNALIHIHGASHTLRGTRGKITPDAIFVGAGSFGVITGQLLGKSGIHNGVLIALLLLAVSCVVIYFIEKKNDRKNCRAQFRIASDKSISFIVLCSFLGVVVRGYVAYAIPIEWNKTAAQSVALFVVMGLGKIMGGVLADAIGFRRLTYLSLLAGLPFLLSGNTNMVLSLIGIAFFSMTMPVTVAVLASVFPKQPGFAFGITTLGLFMGTAPAFFVMPGSLLAHQIVVVVLTAAALPLIIMCIKKEC